MNTLTPSHLTSLLDISDLSSDPNHCIHHMAQQIALAVQSQSPNCPVVWLSGEKIVNAQHNYTLLGYPNDSVVQSNVYTKWVNDTHMLRTQTTSLILEYLLDWRNNPHDVVLLAPGMVYRRDVRDRWHSPTPHQMDVWWLSRRTPSLDNMISAIASACVPNHRVQCTPTTHPYTTNGLELNTLWNDQALEVGECGRIAPSLLSRLGIDATVWGGLAMGWGLDRLVMACKNLPDIRLLRDPLPAVAKQMRDLSVWTSVSRQPSAVRQISILRNQEPEEELVEQVLNSVSESQLVEDIRVLNRWPVSSLPPLARQRLGPTSTSQENVLLQISWQAEDRSLPRAQVNAWLRQVYKAVHQGTQWACLP